MSACPRNRPTRMVSFVNTLTRRRYIRGSVTAVFLTGNKNFWPGGDRRRVRSGATENVKGMAVR